MEILSSRYDEGDRGAACKITRDIEEDIRHIIRHMVRKQTKVINVYDYVYLRVERKDLNPNHHRLEPVA